MISEIEICKIFLKVKHMEIDNSKVTEFIEQLRVLRKWGILPTMIPELAKTKDQKDEWCLMAIANLSGISSEDFKTKFWERVFVRVREEGLFAVRLYQSDGFSQEDQETFAPLFNAALKLSELVD